MSQKIPHVNHKSKQKQAVPQMAAPTSTPPRQARTRTPDGSLSSERPQAFARLSQEERDAMDAAQIPHGASVPQMASAAPDSPSDMDTMLEEARGRPSPKALAPRMRSKSPGRDRAFQNARNRNLPQMASLDTLPPPPPPPAASPPPFLALLLKHFRGLGYFMFFALAFFFISYIVFVRHKKIISLVHSDFALVYVT